MKKLRKTFWLGPTSAGPDDVDVDGIHLQVYESDNEDSFLYEFGIALVQFRDGGFAMQSRVFSDAWKAFKDCPEVFKLLTSMDRCFRGDMGRKGPEPFDELVKKIKEAGWKGVERKQSRYYRMCSQCHQDIPIRQ